MNLHLPATVAQVSGILEHPHARRWTPSIEQHGRGRRIYYRGISPRTATEIVAWCRNQCATVAAYDKDERLNAADAFTWCDRWLARGRELADAR